MTGSRVGGAAGPWLLLSLAASALGQLSPPAPPFRLGIVDSQAVEVELLPDVRLGGLEVLGVVPGSPADAAGLGPCDVVPGANNARIVAPDDLRRAMAVSGGHLRLRVFEAGTGQVLNLTAVLGPRRRAEGRRRSSSRAVSGSASRPSAARRPAPTLTTRDGRVYDLDFRGGKVPDRPLTGGGRSSPAHSPRAGAPSAPAAGSSG